MRSLSWRCDAMQASPVCFESTLFVATLMGHLKSSFMLCSVFFTSQLAYVIPAHLLALPSCPCTFALPPPLCSQ